MDEIALERLFEVERVEDPPCDHGTPTLVEGWRKLVSEVGLCDHCSVVEWIRLAADRSEE
jgi:hypothetical protein